MSRVPPQRHQKTERDRAVPRERLDGPLEFPQEPKRVSCRPFEVHFPPDKGTMRSLVFGLVALLCQTASGEPLQVTLVSLSPHEPAQRTPLTTLTVDPRKRVRLQSTNVSLPPWTLEKTWDPSTLYKLEVQVGKSIRVVQVPLCRLQASRFQETLTLHLNARGDGVIHADLLVPATSCAPGILVRFSCHISVCT